MRPSRRRVLRVAVAGLVLLGAALAAGWYVAEERRLGGIASGMLAVRSGLPVSVERARIERGRLVATPSAIALRRTAAAPDGPSLDAFRDRVLDLVRLDGSLRVRLRGAEVRGRDGSYRLDLTGEKTEAGVVAVTLTLAPAGQPPALRVAVRATAAARGEVDLHVDLAGEPSRLGALWPAALPVPAAVATRSEIRLLAGGAAAATGRLTVGAAVPAVLDFTARYDGAAAALDVSRWTVTQGEALQLTGTMRAEPAGAGLHVAVAARGALDGARVDARARYDGGAFDVDVTAEPVSAAAVWRRLGLGVPPVEATARAGRARLAGTEQARTVSATVDAALDGIEAAPLATPLDGTLTAAVRLVRGDQGLAAGPVQQAAVVLSRGGEPAATITARSRATTLWPLVVEAQVPDAAALAPLLGPATRLAGSGRVAGELDGAAGTPSFRGHLDADVASAELTLGTPVVLTAVRAAGVPVHWNAGGAERPGSVSAGRLRAHGLVLEDIASGATLIDGLLRLPDLRYRHYDGHGSGWAEIAVGGATPLRARVEGERVDLAAVVRDTGSTMARVTGRVRYTGSLQQLRGRGVDAVVQVHSQEGGEIGVEAIEGLLASTAVEVESTGLLRQTLENLRVFEYESLDGELRAADGRGTVDLSIKGRRHLWLFPGPVQAINFRNVPLDVLGSTLDRGISR